MKNIKIAACFYMLPLVILSIFAVGCGGLTRDKNIQNYIQKELREEKGITPYLLHVGDTIEVKFYYNPELNDIMKIRSDGNISLQLIDEINAAGLTPAELDNAITARYSKILNKPDVTVIVRESVSEKIFVGGEVNSPGVFAFEKGMILPHAIFEAGGFKDTAELKSIILVRKSADNKLISMSIDMSGMVSNDVSYTGVNYLLPYDIVFVPKTFIAEVDKFVDQYIIKVLPIKPGVGLWYPLN